MNEIEAMITNDETKKDTRAGSMRAMQHPFHYHEATTLVFLVVALQAHRTPASESTMNYANLVLKTSAVSYLSTPGDAASENT